MTSTSPVAVPGHGWKPTYEARQGPGGGNKTDADEGVASARTRADSFVPSAKSTMDPRGSIDLDSLRKSAAEAGPSSGKSMDLTEFHKAMKGQLIEQMRQAQIALKSAGKDSKLVSDILYAVDNDEKAAAVPDEWGADQTAQRIVDFALAFRGSVKGMTPEGFIETIRKAIQDGFRAAKGDLKAIPGPSAKLFNDTYEAAMKKLDDTLSDWQNAAQAQVDGSAAGTAPATPVPSTGPSVASGFSVLA